MKRSRSMLVAVAAAAATAVSYDSNSSHISHQEEDVNGEQKRQEKNKCSDKFSPSFDGLRFIETLVTAHR
ncbi:hypothetical protein AG4045_004604 [Apium graveolens]|uniref:Uncharacterized protein n=1 Tax=Apium graveolens TaxID=4045 RepID=A0A6L5BA00_APIGR|nr:hypothetical protein AG4045_004604 [Apium graveolens]